MESKTLIGLVVVAIIAIGAYWFPQVSSFLGGATNYDALGVEELKIGVDCNDSPTYPTCGGSAVTALNSGTCNASFDGTSLAATSSGTFICSASNVLSGDKVFVSLPIGAKSGANLNFVEFSGYATTTGKFGFAILNMTGAATTSFVQATTSVQYWIVR